MDRVICDVYDANFAVSLEVRNGRKILVTRRNLGGCWYDDQLTEASRETATDLTAGMTAAAPTIARLIEQAT